MLPGGLTYLDAAVIAVALISGILAMYRGLTREVLSITSWAVAALAGLFVVLNFQDQARQAAKEIGVSLPIAQGVIATVVFVIVLIIVHLLTSKIADRVLDSNVGMIDRILGFAFGAARGFLLIAVAYMLAGVFIERGKFPAWVEQAQTKGALDDTSDVVSDLLRRAVPKSLTGDGDEAGTAS